MLSRPPGSRVTLEDLAGPAAADVLAGLRDTAPVSWVPAIGGWLVTTHEAAGRVIRDDAGFTVDHPGFSTARVTGASMLSLDGAQHRRHRRAFAAPFGPRQVAERFDDTVHRVAADLLAAVRDAGRAELRVSFAGPLAVIVVADALGLEAIDTDAVLDWYAHIVSAVSAMTPDSPAPADAVRAMTQLGTHVRRGLRAGPRSLLGEASQALTEAEIVSNAAVMMFGGIETTEGMILNALLCLLRHSDAMTEVRDDPAALDAAVEESLRLEPAAGAVDRYGRET